MEVGDCLAMWLDRDGFLVYVHWKLRLRNKFDLRTLLGRDIDRLIIAEIRVNLYFRIRLSADMALPALVWVTAISA